MITCHHIGTQSCVVALAILCQVATAQRPDRELVGSYVFGSALVMGSASADELRLTVPSEGTTTIVAPYPLEAGGDVIVFGDQVVLISGRISGDGALILYARSGGAGSLFVEADRRTWAGADIAGIGYDDVNGELYLLDYGLERILRAPYSAGSALPTIWETFVTASEVPFLSDPAMADYTLEVIGQVDRALVSHYTEVFERTSVWIDTINAGFTEAASARNWAELASEPIVGATSVSFRGVPGDAVSIMEGDASGNWVQIGSGVVGANGEGAASVAGLGFGAIVAAQSSYTPDHPTPPFLTSVERSGFATALDSASTIRPLSKAIALRCFAGSEDVDVGLFIDHFDPSNVVVPASYLSILAIGTAADISPLPNGQAFLDTPVQLSTQAQVQSSDTPGYAELGFPIPDDQGLVGLSLCFQWWVITAQGGVAFSDILCTVIRDDPYIGPHIWTILDPKLNDAPDSAVIRGNPGLRAVQPKTVGREFGSAIVSGLVSGHSKRVSEAEAKALIRLLRGI